MAYSENILPLVASGYELTNATLVNGVLNISAGGSATCTITEETLATLTEYFRVHMLPSAFTASYAPRIYMYLAIHLADDTYLNTSCMPTVDSSGIYSADIKLESSDYNSFTVTIYSEDAVSLTLWELRPELSSDVSIVIDGVKQSLPKLLYDRNYEPFTIKQATTQIANITYYLQNGTDLQGHLLLNYVASLPGTLTLHFIDNDASELFGPLTYDIHAGRGSIGVPHAYLNRLAGIHNTYITARISAGTITVGTCGILFTLDGGYLAERLISLGTDIRDFAIRQISAEAGPDEVWTVGIDDGYLIIRKGAFSTRGIDFEPVSTLANVSNAAVEFDGNFVITNQTAYTIETNAAPYVFYTDNSKTLYVKYWTALSEPIQLDTNVETFSVCRGFKAPYVPENDQGLICAYIKTDGNVYYKYYAYSNDGYYWLGPLQLRNSADASSIHIHRLNDYRVGIVVTTDDENIWYISDRTYVEQAIKPETGSYNLSEFAGRVYMIPSGYSEAQSLSSSVTNNKIITITSSHRLIFLGAQGTLDRRLMLSGGASNYDINSASISGNTITIELKEASYQDITVTLETAYFAYYDANNARHPLDVSTILVRNGLLFNEHATYNITSITGLVTMRGTQYISAYNNEIASYSIAMSGSASQVAVTYLNKDYTEHALYNISNITGLATMIKIGVEPI